MLIFQEVSINRLSLAKECSMGDMSSGKGSKRISVPMGGGNYHSVVDIFRQRLATNSLKCESFVGSETVSESIDSDKDVYRSTSMQIGLSNLCLDACILWFLSRCRQAF